MNESSENQDPQIQEETITSVTEDMKSNNVVKVETSDNLTEASIESQTNGHTEEDTKTENVSSTEESGEAKEKEAEKDEMKTEEEQANKKDESLSSTVAQHYNEIPATTRETRKESRIFYLRNFNNWVKSVVINEFMEKIKRKKRTSDEINVLDLGCGKGGDLLKWEKARVDHVIMADIAETSIEQCKERYTKLQKDHRGSRHSGRLFSTDIFAADCTKDIISENFQKKDIKLDMTSCQFAFHYSFESYEQAEVMLKNACENLRVGGYFVGTTPDANKLVKRIKESKADSFGNSVFNIKPDNHDQFPLFGSKYMFYLEGVVDCPEFLVHMPTLEALASKYDMKLVWKKNFHEIFKEFQRQHFSLLSRIKALEPYPAPKDKTLTGVSESQYKAAREYIDKKGCKQAGTLSADEWEVAGLYLAFGFEKVDKDGRISSDSRKRQRDRSHDRSHGEKRHSSSSSKRTKKDATGEELYEVKDEFYEPEESETMTKPSENTQETTTKKEENIQNEVAVTPDSTNDQYPNVADTSENDVKREEEPMEQQQDEPKQQLEQDATEVDE